MDIHDPAITASIKELDALYKKLQVRPLGVSTAFEDFEVHAIDFQKLWVRVQR